MPNPTPSPGAAKPDQANSLMYRFLARVERLGNALPDPAMLFVALLGLVWLLSWALSGIDFGAKDPHSGLPLVVVNQLSGPAFAAFMSNLVKNFTSFHPIGVVLVAMLGIGVAEHTGFISAGLRALLAVTARRMLTPLVIIVGLFSHTAADAGYVLVIPLGGIIFYAAGRHPLAGIAAAFAGVSGAYSASFIPATLDPMLQGITQASAQLIDPNIVLNPLNNYFFTASSTLLIVAAGWLITDWFVEPRLASSHINGDLDGLPTLEPLSTRERRSLWGALAAMLVATGLLIFSTHASDSSWRNSSGELTASDSALMQSIVPLIFLFFLLPGIVYGVLSGSVKSSRDIIAGMTQAMSSMSYYLVIMFFISQFVYAFSESHLGVLLAIKGAAPLQALHLSTPVAILAVIALTTVVNIFIGSASAKWALLAPVLVPLTMQIGISPDLTQAAYRIGDSSTHVITPLMPYFPLVVVYCQRYIKEAGIGTVAAMMMPYTMAFLVIWTAFLLFFWSFGIPLGLGAHYTYPAL